MSTRPEPPRAATLAAALALAYHDSNPAPHRVALAVAAMQKAARAAKRNAERECNEPMSNRELAMMDDREQRLALKAHDALALAVGVNAATLAFGGDPRGPCAWLTIPSLPGDGWADSRATGAPWPIYD